MPVEPLKYLEDFAQDDTRARWPSAPPRSGTRKTSISMTAASRHSIFGEVVASGNLTLVIHRLMLDRTLVSIGELSAGH